MREEKKRKRKRAEGLYLQHIFVLATYAVV
jgi:hypothetical protein